MYLREVIILVVLFSLQLIIKNGQKYLYSRVVNNSDFALNNSKSRADMTSCVNMTSFITHEVFLSLSLFF